jgi:hypothetical protein
MYTIISIRNGTSGYTFQKRTLLILSLITTLFIVPMKGQLVENRTLTLRDIGYANDMVMAGVRPYQAFFFPLPEGDIDADSSYIIVEFRFSNALQPHSVINFQINDQPAASYRVQQLNSLGAKIRLPFNGTMLNLDVRQKSVSAPRFVKLIVTGSLTTTTSSCEDNDNGANWIVVLNSTKLTLKFKHEGRYDATIASFLPSVTTGVRIVLPRYLNKQTTQTAIWILSDLLKRPLPGLRNSAIVRPGHAFNSMYDYIAIGTLGAIPTMPSPYNIDVERFVSPKNAPLKKDQGVIFLHNTVGNARILYITGYTDDAVEKAASAFILDHMRLTMLNRNVSVNTITAITKPKFSSMPYKVSFAQLGYDNSLVQGSGKIRSSITFLRQSLGVAPRNIMLNVFGSNSDIGPGDRAFVSIYFNDLLLASTALEKGGKFPLMRIDLPNYAIQGENKVDIEFIYTTKNPCEGKWFIGNISNISYFEIQDQGVDNTPSFDLLADVFAFNTILVISPRISFRTIETAASMLSIVDRDNKSKYLYPKLYLSNGVTQRDLERSNVIGLLDRGDRLFNYFQSELPVDPTNNFRVVNMQDRNAMFEYNAANVSLGIIQFFRPFSRNHMLLATPVGEEGPVILHRFVQEVLKHPRLLEGNIGLYGESGNMYFFNSSQNAVTIDYPEEDTIWKMLERNEFIVFIGLWLLFTAGVISLTVYTRRQSLKAGQFSGPQTMS